MCGIQQGNPPLRTKRIATATATVNFRLERTEHGDIPSRQERRTKNTHHPP